MQNLTLAKVRAAGRKAYNARRLTAQHRNQDSRDCVYERDSYRCVIGWALTEASLKKVREGSLNDGVGIDGIVDEGVIAINPDEGDQLIAIQTAHDNWAACSCKQGGTSADALRARARFLRLINHPGAPKDV